MAFKLEFSKMHSGFNDFVIIDVRANDYELMEIKKYATRIASREEGIGCDQILVISNSERADCEMIVFNSDGTESFMCANGLRCVGRLIAQENNRDENTIEISGVVYKTKRERSDMVSINIGKPKLSWKEIPLACEMQTPVMHYSSCGFSNPIVLNIGNPHAVFFVGEEIALEDIDLPKVGREIENDPLFPEKVNVSFVKLRDGRSLFTRVWERGAGETKSCGSAASAIGWASKFHLCLPSSLEIYFSPDIKISVEILPDDSIRSTAKAEIMYEAKTFELA
jgi:diaminopimelate epimerase